MRLHLDFDYIACICETRNDAVVSDIPHSLTIVLENMEPSISNILEICSNSLYGTQSCEILSEGGPDFHTIEELELDKFQLKTTTWK